MNHRKTYVACFFEKMISVGLENIDQPKKTSIFGRLSSFNYAIDDNLINATQRSDLNLSGFDKALHTLVVNKNGAQETQSSEKTWSQAQCHTNGGWILMDCVDYFIGNNKIEIADIAVSIPPENKTCELLAVKRKITSGAFSYTLGQIYVSAATYADCNQRDKYLYFVSQHGSSTKFESVKSFNVVMLTKKYKKTPKLSDILTYFGKLLLMAYIYLFKDLGCKFHVQCVYSDED